MGGRTDPPPSALPAGEVVGLLADGDRLRVVAALVLGAATTDEVTTATGLDLRAAVTALGRLADRGLVEQDGHGWRLAEEELRASARATASLDPPSDEHADLPAEAARVLRAFVRGGRLVDLPAQRAKRMVVLDLVAQDLEPGRRYLEAAVNDILRRWHDDTAALRRHLVDEGLVAREAGVYWRIGGTVLTGGATGRRASGEGPGGRPPG